MQHRDTKANTTGQVLAHVERARGSLRSIRADNLSVDGVFFNPQVTLATLKIVREELNKAIDLMDQTRWT